MQEACTNALKYADAKEICVVLEYTENDISLVIEDDGIGFNTKKKLQKANIVLNGIVDHWRNLQ